jgi:hypothetical protein
MTRFRAPAILSCWHAAEEFFAFGFALTLALKRAMRIALGLRTYETKATHGG